MQLSSICKAYRNLLREEGFVIEKYKCPLLKSRITEYFGTRISFHRQRRRTDSQYVFTGTVNPGPLIERCLQLEAKQDAEQSGKDLTLANMPDFIALDHSDHTTIYNDTDVLGAPHVYWAAKIMHNAILSLPSMPHSISS